MSRYLYGAACAAVGATMGWAIGATLDSAVASANASSATYAAEHASDCERDVTAAARDPQSARDRTYSGVVCAGYQQGRFDEMVSRALRP